MARGFQELDKPQSDSPTALRESFKLFMAVAANQDFSLASVDIRAAFLQAKVLDRDVYVKPPKDVAKTGILWKLKKPLYGLDDASRKFWLRIREVFLDAGMKTLEGDEAFYYKRDGNDLEGMVLTHVDDFTIGGKDSFVKNVIDKLNKEMTVSKVERNSFRFTGVDIKRTEEGIEISMNDYADSLEEIVEIRDVKRDEPLTKIEMKLYRKMTGKVSWLAENVRSDLCFTALEMSKKNKSATIADLKNINKVIRKIREQENRVVFSKIGTEDNLEIMGAGDASYKSDAKSIGGNVIMMVDKQSSRASPLYWKSKQIDRVAHSSKDAETLNLSKLVDDTVYVGRQIETLLFGSYSRTIPIKFIQIQSPHWSLLLQLVRWRENL